MTDRVESDGIHGAWAPLWIRRRDATMTSHGRASDMRRRMQNPRLAAYGTEPRLSRRDPAGFRGVRPAPAARRGCLPSHRRSHARPRRPSWHRATPPECRPSPRKKSGTYCPQGPRSTRSHGLRGRARRTAPPAARGRRPVPENPATGTMYRLRR